MAEIPEQPSSAEADAPVIARGPRGHFLPGQSGNPRGAQAGRGVEQNALRKLMQADGAAIAQVVIDKAKEGDLYAAQLVLARLAPPLRPVGERVHFEFDLKAPLMEQAQQVVSAVADGSLSVEAGHMLVQCLTNAAGLKAMDELAMRLTALEGKAQRPGHFAAGMVIDATLLGPQAEH